MYLSGGAKRQRDRAPGRPWPARTRARRRCGRRPLLDARRGLQGSAAASAVGLKPPHVEAELEGAVSFAHGALVTWTSGGAPIDIAAPACTRPGAVTARQ